MGRKFGLIDAVEACYALDVPTRDAWLRALFEKVTPLLDEGRGGMAIIFDARGAPGSWKLERPLTSGFPDEIADATLATFARMPEALRVLLYRGMGPVGTYAQATRTLVSSLVGEEEREFARGIAVANFAVLNGANPDGQGATLMFTTGRETRLSATTHPHLARLCSHVGAGFRLASEGAARNPAAIFEPSGKEVHVDGQRASDLRGRLRDAVKNQERARGRLRRTDEREAVKIWQALVAGRYSLVDRFESDGRRYVVAHENRPSAPDPRGLTEEERVVAGWVAHGHSDKLIAYDLGWPEGTVRAMTHRILKKLGLRSRVEVVTHFQAPEAVRRVLVAGGSVVALQWKAKHREHPPLSKAESDILSLIVSGRSTNEIATLRKRSTRTIANQLASAYRKLGVRSRAEAARLLA